MSQAVAVSDMTKDELFAEVRRLEPQAIALISDDSREEEFYTIMERVSELNGEARRKGWLP